MKNEEEIVKFMKSTKKFKKYDAIIYNKITKKTRKVSFGDIRYQQYKDKIGLYKDKDHNDKERRRLYRKRHYKTHFKKYSPSWFSWYFLW